MALFPANEAPQPIAPHGINKWSLSSRIFHWISVVLLIATWAMIELNEDATDFTYFDLHKAFGLSVLFWTVGRIINRFVTKAQIDTETTQALKDVVIIANNADHLVISFIHLLIFHRCFILLRPKSCTFKSGHSSCFCFRCKITKNI